MSKDAGDDTLRGHIRELSIDFLINAHFLGESVGITTIKIGKRWNLAMDYEADATLSIVEHLLGDAVGCADDHLVDPLACEHTEDAFLKIHEGEVGTFDGVDGGVIVDSDEKVITLGFGLLEQLCMSNVYKVSI